MDHLFCYTSIYILIQEDSINDSGNNAYYYLIIAKIN